MRNFYDPIFLSGTPEEIEAAIPFIKASEWKPMIIPMLRAEDIIPIVFDPIECEKYKFTFLIPSKE